MTMYDNMLLVHMGNDDQHVSQASRMNDLSWEEVYQKQQFTNASLVLIIAHTDSITTGSAYAKQLATTMGASFPRWDYEYYRTDTETFILAWEHHNWYRQSSYLIHALRHEHSRCGDRNAMVVTMEDHRGMTLRLVLANIFQGISTADNALNPHLIDECWRILIENAIAEPHWLLLGDLATHSPVNLINRVIQNSDTVRSGDTIGCIKDENPLAIVSCNTELMYASFLSDRQSVVFKLTPTKFQDQFKSKIVRSLMRPCGLMHLREWLFALAEADAKEMIAAHAVAQDNAGIEWEVQTCLFNIGEKIEKAMNLITDARASAGASGNDGLTHEQFRIAIAHLETRNNTEHSQRHCKTNNDVRSKCRSRLRAFCKQQIGDHAFAMHLLKYGVTDDEEEMGRRYKYITNAKPMINEIEDRHTRKSHPKLYATALEAREKYHEAKVIAHRVDNDEIDFNQLSPDEKAKYKSFKDYTLRDEMYAANRNWGHGPGVRVPVSTVQKANLQYDVTYDRKRKRDQ